MSDTEQKKRGNLKEFIFITLIIFSILGASRLLLKKPMTLEYHIAEPNGLMWKNCGFKGNTWTTQNLTITVWGTVYFPLGHNLILDGNNKSSVLNFIEKMVFYGANVKVLQTSGGTE